MLFKEMRKKNGFTNRLYNNGNNYILYFIIIIYIKPLYSQNIPQYCIDQFNATVQNDLDQGLVGCDWVLHEAIDTGAGSTYYGAVITCTEPTELVYGRGCTYQDCPAGQSYNENGECELDNSCNRVCADICSNIGEECIDTSGGIAECIDISGECSGDNGTGGGFGLDQEDKDKLTDIEINTRTTNLQEEIDQYKQDVQRTSETWLGDEFDYFAIDEEGKAHKIENPDEFIDPELRDMAHVICTKDGSNCAIQPPLIEEPPYVYPKEVNDPPELKEETTITEPPDPLPPDVKRQEQTKVTDPSKGGDTVITQTTNTNVDNSRSTTIEEGPARQSTPRTKEDNPPFCIYAERACSFMEKVEEWIKFEPTEYPDPDRTQIFKEEDISIDYFNTIILPQSSANACVSEPIVISIMGSQITLSPNFQPFCDLAIQVRPFLLILSLLVSARIINDSI